MSAHSGFPWKSGEPVTDDLVAEVARCVNFNRTGYRFTPPVYGTFTPVDGLIFNLGLVLDAWDHESDFKGHVSGWKDVPEFFVDLAVRAFPLIELPPAPKDRPRAKMPDKITIPNIKKEVPKL